MKSITLIVVLCSACIAIALCKPADDTTESPGDKSKKTPNPNWLGDVFRGLGDQIKDFFKSSPIFQLRTISGLICNVTRPYQFDIGNVGPNLVVDIPVTVLIQSAKFVSCHIAKTGEVVDKSVIEQELSEHRDQVVRMRLVNPCDRETKVFEAEKYVDPSDEPLHHEWDEKQRLDCPNNSNVRSIPSFVIIVLVTATTSFIGCP